MQVKILTMFLENLNLERKLKFQCVNLVSEETELIFVASLMDSNPAVFSVFLFTY